jgi:uncharacterized membrane protein
MNAAHLHLVLTHFPIVGTAIGIGILIYGQLVKNSAIKKVSYGIFIVMAILTIPVFQTGEGAEETVEHLAGVSEELIEKHEELAEKAIWLMAFLGVLSVVNLFVSLKNYPLAKVLGLITLIVSLGTFGLFAKVGNLGGQIRHSEIRILNTGNQNPQSESHHEENEHEEDHD